MKLWYYFLSAFSGPNTLRCLHCGAKYVVGRDSACYDMLGRVLIAHNYGMTDWDKSDQIKVLSQMRTEKNVWFCKECMDCNPW